VRDLQEISGIGSSGRSSPESADGAGARPESTRERGLPVAGGGGPGAWSGGEARAFKRRSRRGVGTGERVEQRERGASGSTAARQRGKRREKMGSRAWECHAALGCRGAWPRPADVARQRPENRARGRRAPHARVPGREGADRGTIILHRYHSTERRAISSLNKDRSLCANCSRDHIKTEKRVILTTLLFASVENSDTFTTAINSRLWCAPVFGSF
jgi:hypothetical protein